MTPHDLEKRLVEIYAREAELYARALAALQAGTGAASMQTLMGTLTEVADLEAHGAAAKAEWQRLQHRPGTELATHLQRVAGLIQTLRTHVAAAVENITAQRRALLPLVDQAVQQRRMQQAYGGIRPASGAQP